MRIESKPEHLSNGQILHVLHSLNDGEIQQAELAIHNSSNPQVGTAARRLLDEHSASNERITQLAQTAGIQLEDNPLSDELTTQTSALKERLAKLSGEDFNREYLQRTVELHHLALATVRSQLIPKAEDPQVKQLLNEEAPKLEQHLQEVQEKYDRLTQPPGP